MKNPKTIPTLTQTLDSIAAWHQEHHPRSAQALQAPIKPTKLAKLASELPFELPPELKELYAWHNGQDRNAPFFGSYTFFPFEEALEEYELAIENAQEQSLDWKTSLFPIFGFQGDYFLLDCASQPAPVYMYHSQVEGIPCWYENLKKMLLTVATCFQEGAYDIDDDDIFSEDFEKAEAIRLRINRQVDRFASEEELSDFEPYQEVQTREDGFKIVTTWQSEQEKIEELFGPDSRKREQNLYWGEELVRRDLWEFVSENQVVITSENMSGMMFSTRAHAEILPSGEVVTQRIETIVNGEVVSDQDLLAVDEEDLEETDENLQ
jgi:hypothetical protein